LVDARIQPAGQLLPHDGDAAQTHERAIYSEPLPQFGAIIIGLTVVAIHQAIDEQTQNKGREVTRYFGARVPLRSMLEPPWQVLISNQRAPECAFGFLCQLGTLFTKEGKALGSNLKRPDRIRIPIHSLEKSAR
jgi:hypothetical protein